MTEDELRSLLRELRDEPAPPDSLARVRLAVAEGSQAGSWTQWLGGRWKKLALLAAAAMVLLIAVRWRPSHQVVPTRIIPNETADSRVPSTPPVSHTKVRKSVAAKLHNNPRRKPPSTEEGVLVRIETADPDVVILLVGE